MTNGIHPYDGSFSGYNRFNTGSLNQLGRAAGDLFNDVAQSLPADSGSGEPSRTPVGVRSGGWNPMGPTVAAQPAAGPSTATRAAVGQHLDAAAQKHGIPPDLLKAVAWQGSAWDPEATSFDGGHKKGVMQVDDRYHPFAQTSAAFDPQANIDFGAGQLRRSYDTTGNWDETLRAQGGQTYASVVRSIQQRQPWAKYESGTNDAGAVGNGGAESTPGVAAENAASTPTWTSMAVNAGLGRTPSSAASPRQQFSIFGPNGVMERRNRSGNALNPLIPPSLTPTPPPEYEGEA